MWTVIRGIHAFTNEPCGKRVFFADSDPVCEIRNGIVRNETVILIAEDLLEIDCSITFNGNWLPHMECQSDDGKDFKTGRRTEVTGPPHRIFTSTFSRPASSIKHGSRVSCATNFHPHPPFIDKRIATDIPTYSNTWKSLEISILCEWIFYNCWLFYCETMEVMEHECPHCVPNILSGSWNINRHFGRHFGRLLSHHLGKWSRSSIVNLWYFVLYIICAIDFSDPSDMLMGVEIIMFCSKINCEPNVYVILFSQFLTIPWTKSWTLERCSQI